MTKRELLAFSKRDLIRMLLQQEERISLLERRLLAYENAHTPSSKRQKKSRPPQTTNRFPGKPKGSSGGSIELPEPDFVEEHSLDTCPSCGSGALARVRVREKHVLDIPTQPILCTKHLIHEYQCKECRKRVMPRVILPQGTYGYGVQAASNQLKVAGLSYAQISRFWKSLGAPSICAPTILSFTKHASKQLKKIRSVFANTLKQAPLVHKDETTFRQDGKNGYVWVGATQDTCIFNVDLSRGQEAADRLQGLPEQISVVDGYKAYNGIKARCWAHLLRDAQDLQEQESSITDQVTRLKNLFTDLTYWINDPPNTHFSKAKWELDDIIICLQARGLKGNKLATTIKNGGNDWLTALLYNNIPLTNNHAERMLRPVVLLRKRMGCYRNEHGKNFIENVLSVLTTWRLRELNPFTTLIAQLT